MQLVLRRSQKSAGLISKSVIFCLDTRVDLNNEEQSLVSRYKLGGETLYNSENFQAHAEKAAETGSSRGLLSGVVHFALAKLSLRITIESLMRGHHVECKDLAELLAAEEAIKSACENIQSYLRVALTFDGRETILDIGDVATS